MPKKPAKPGSPKYRARVGYEAEYYLVKKFEGKAEPGFYAIRTPGSGAGKMAKPDLIAVDDGELLAIEVKSTRKDYAMMNKDQLNRLLEFCRRFVVRCPHCNATIEPKPALAVRFLGRGWKFVRIPSDHQGSFIVRKK